MAAREASENEMLQGPNACLEQVTACLQAGVTFSVTPATSPTHPS
jgi:hypothetical protein